MWQTWPRNWASISTVDEADPIAYQRERGISSFEEAAREVRYRFLTNLANTINADAIALGHTADDQAETILMHIIRGTGLPGLRGMQELTPWRDTPKGKTATLFRPLLEATREVRPAPTALNSKYPSGKTPPTALSASPATASGFSSFPPSANTTRKCDRPSSESAAPPPRASTS